MDNYKEVLEYLIDLKKTKKEPNRIERDQFTEAWQCLVAAEGYSEQADSFLYNGFTYCGASVIKHYIKNSDDQVAALREVFSGKMYGKNCASTVPVLFHLFTLLMNEKHPDLLLISEIIKRLPSALKNKEGKIYGQADRALKKYILDDLHCDELPCLADFLNKGLKQAFVNDFVSAIDEILSGMKSDGFSKKCLRNIQLIQKWLHPVVTEEGMAGQEVNAAVETCSKEKVDDSSASQEASPEETEQPALPSEIDIYKEKLDEASREMDGLRAEIEKQRNLANMLKQQLAEANAEKVRISELAGARETRIFALTEELSNARKNLKKLQEQVEQLEKELQERMIMVEALSRDRAKQSDEAFNRLASKLKIEYRDFMDAIDVPMDGDLGENMREQLKNVFNILIKAGIAIN